MKLLSERDYNFIYSRSPRVCVDLIIRKNGKVFLLKRKNQPYKGKYHLPGGRVMFRESISKAIQRIAKNEIGCGVVIGKQVGFMEFPREIQGGNKRHSISIAFLVKPLRPVCITDVHEHRIHPVHYKFLKSIA